MTQLISPDRLRDVLLKIQACTQRRDEALAKLSTQVNNSDHLDSCVSWIDDSFPDQIRTAAENAATMAAQVQTAGRGAETSYRNVKDMDERLARVRQSLDVVRAVAAQRESLATVGASVRNRDWEAAVSCVEKFDAVSKVLGGFTFVPPPSQPSHSAASGDGESFSSAHDGAHNSSVGGGSEDGDGGHSLGSSDVSSPLTTSSSSTIPTARLQLHDDLLDQIRVARAEKKVEEVSKYCSMLARLGFMDEGRDAFTEFVVASVKDDLKTFVERALDDIKAAKTTHLMACVAVLDRIAAAMERHKSYVDTNFKGQSSALMLSLHAEATSHCVDVLKDFLKSRNAVVGRAEKGGRDNSRARSQPSNLDPRSLDQTLEDISHLLTCCHQYVSFVTSCVVSSSDSKEKQQSMRAKVRDSPLFQQLGGLMGVYVPVQTEYLDAAFRVVVQQCDQTIARVLTPISSVLSTSTASSSSSGIMGALWGGGASSNTSAAMLSEYTVGSRKLETLLADLEVSLVDDIFHLMLVAIRRAMSTRDVSIASSALMATNNVLTDLVLPELKRRIETSDASAASPVTASSASSAEVAIAAAVTARIRALWLQAAASATDYVVKLSLDAEQCAAANFTGSDVFRLTEQRHDFATTGTLMREALNGWLAAAGKRIAAVFNDSAAMSHDAANYVLKTEAAYVAAGINDNWVTLGSSAMKECVDEFQAPFPEASRDVIILSALDGILARALATVPKKNYDAFGALQLDREVRALRIFIASLTEMPIRDRFTQLQAVTQVLMADTPAEAEAEGSAAGLDKALTATLISRRVEFDSKPARN